MRTRRGSAEENHALTCIRPRSLRGFQVARRWDREEAETRRASTRRCFEGGVKPPAGGGGGELAGEAECRGSWGDTDFSLQQLGRWRNLGHKRAVESRFGKAISAPPSARPGLWGTRITSIPSGPSTGQVHGRKLRSGQARPRCPHAERVSGSDRLVSALGGYLDTEFDKYTLFKNVNSDCVCLG